MGFANIAVFVDDRPASNTRLDFAANIALTHGSSLTVVFVEIPPASLSGEAVADAYARGTGIRSVANSYNDGEDHARAAISQRLSEMRRLTGLSSELRKLPLTANTTEAIQHAHYTDLAILGRPDESDPGNHPYGWSLQKVIRAINAPLIIVPSNSQPPDLDCVAIAWNSSNESHRAVRDAMPLLEKSRGVIVLIVDPKIGATTHGAEPGADIARFLARHGITSTVERISAGHSTLARVLLKRTAELSAGLLVAGAYGRSRLVEFAGGSTTDELLSEAAIPIFFSR